MIIGFSVALVVAIALIAALAARNKWEHRGHENRNEDSSEPIEPEMSDQIRTIPSAVETAEAVLVDPTEPPNEPIAVVGTPSDLPTYKDQARGVRHGPQVAFMAHALPERQEPKAVQITDSRRLPDP